MILQTVSDKVSPKVHNLFANVKCRYIGRGFLRNINRNEMFCINIILGSGKKRKFFQRRAKSNFNIPVVVISDENGQYLDPEGFAEEFETKTVHVFP